MKGPSKIMKLVIFRPYGLLQVVNAGISVISLNNLPVHTACIDTHLTWSFLQTMFLLLFFFFFLAFSILLLIGKESPLKY